MQQQQAAAPTVAYQHPQGIAGMHQQGLAFSASGFGGFGAGAFGGGVGAPVEVGGFGQNAFGTSAFMGFGCVPCPGWQEGPPGLKFAAKDPLKIRHFLTGHARPHPRRLLP